MPTPTVGNISPAEGALGDTQDDARWQPISMTASVDGDDTPLVLAELGDDPCDVLTVYDGESFAPGFEAHSTAEVASPDHELSILPTGGWLEAVELKVYGWSAADRSLAYLMPDKPDAEPPTLSELGKLLGRDIQMIDGAFPVGPHGDYRTIEGPDHLARSVERRFLVALREYQLEPDYGIGLADAIYEPGSGAKDEELRQRAIEQLLQDRRVVDVTHLDFARPQANPAKMRVSVTVVHVESDAPETFRFTVPVGA